MTSTIQTPTIKIDALSFNYKSIEVLKSINLSVHKGDYLGIIGPNGGGKTTLLRCMLGLLPHTVGTIALYGQPFSAFKEWSKIGYISQKVTQTEQHFPITVKEVVTLGRISSKKFYEKITKHDQDIIKTSLANVEMSAYSNALLSELSGGQQQRVFIAKALASEPDLLILDEPTVGIDTQSQDSFYALLKELHQKHAKTIVLVSHDIDVIAKEVSTLACLNKELVYHGSPNEFKPHHSFEKLYGKGKTLVAHAH